jgi:UPF0716 protein FxsA
MRRLLFGLILLALPLVEIGLLIRVGQRIGLWSTLAIIVGTGMLGILVLVRQRFAVVAGVMQAVNEGKTPLAPVLDSAFLVLAGGLLFSPGLISDAAGLLLLVPPIRRLVARWSVERLLRNADIRVSVHGQGPPGPGRQDGGTIIEGEFERVDERSTGGDSKSLGKP